jgi:hypothetical protein
MLIFFVDSDKGINLADYIFHLLFSPQSYQLHYEKIALFRIIYIFDAK